MKLSILSYNIHKGFNFGNRSFVLSEIRDAVRKLSVDLVFLQEVLGDHKVHAQRLDDWPNQSQFEFLADEIWPHYSYGKNAVYDAGHHGNAILSKYPIIQSENVDISTNRFEMRGILHVTLEIPETGARIHCINVHLNLLHLGRAHQVRQLCERVKTFIPEGEPWILAGDFNDWSERLSRVLEGETGARDIFRFLKGKPTATFPSKFPILKFDRIYLSGFQSHSAEVLTGDPWNRLSDHSPIRAEIEFGKS